MANDKTKLTKFGKRKNSVDISVFGDELDFGAHEAYRMLRTNIMFSFTGEKRCRVIGVVSSVKAEGKTTTSINLSYVLAESDARVCLIEGDMRMPHIGERLEIKKRDSKGHLSNKTGLSELLTGQAKLENAIVKKQFKNCSVDVITSGRIPPNPSELLSSAVLDDLIEKLSQKYDYIVFDLPPVDVVSDAVVLGSRLDGVVMVVSEGYVSKKQLSEAMRQLAMANIKVIGFVRTFVNAGGFGKYKSNYKYKKYGGGYTRTLPESRDEQQSK